jgi:large subunit ribosomal protein L21
MYAVVKTGGKQYRVTPGDVILVEKLLGEAGGNIKLEDVLMIGEDGKAPEIGAPTVAKAAVNCEILDQSRADKVIVFKKKKRKGYRRLNGHRQEQTVLRVLDINGKGAVKPKAAAKPKAEDRPKAEAKPKAPAKAKAPVKAKAAAKPKAAAKSKAAAEPKAPSKKDD